MLLGTFTEVVEHTRAKVETSILLWLVSHHKIFIGVVLVELYQLHLAIVFLFENRVCESLCREGLTNTRRTLQNNVLFVKKQSTEIVIIIF